MKRAVLHTKEKEVGNIGMAKKKKSIYVRDKNYKTALCTQRLALAQSTGETKTRWCAPVQRSALCVPGANSKTKVADLR